MKNITILNKSYKLQEDTIFATQDELASIFEVERSVVTKHIKNIFKTSELAETSVCAILAHTGKDGKTYQVKHYSFDMIIAVGYRVNSKKATQFRIEATKILKEYLTTGKVVSKIKNNQPNIKYLNQKPFKLKFNNQTMLLIQNPETEELLFNFNILCENIGLDSSNQRVRIRKDELLSSKLYQAKGRLNQISYYLPVNTTNYFLEDVYVSRNNKDYNIKTQLLELYKEDFYHYCANNITSITQNTIQANKVEEIKQLQQLETDKYYNKSNTYNKSNKYNEVVNLLTKYISTEEANIILSKYQDYDYIIANINTLLSYSWAKMTFRFIEVALKNDCAAYYFSKRLEESNNIGKSDNVNNYYFKENIG
jgi:hypothetical protein